MYVFEPVPVNANTYGVQSASHEVVTRRMTLSLLVISGNLFIAPKAVGFKPGFWIPCSMGNGVHGDSPLPKMSGLRCLSGVEGGIGGAVSTQRTVPTVSKITDSYFRYLDVFSFSHQNNL